MSPERHLEIGVGYSGEKSKCYRKKHIQISAQLYSMDTASIYLSKYLSLQASVFLAVTWT